VELIGEFLSGVQVMKKGKECLPFTTLSTPKEFKVNRPAFSLGINCNNSLTILIT
jgi:hypothetical protein